ncbi:MAG: hypothetical protein KJZ87_27905 [Thermoguttaceae bacterium]|nr:hypothetical protein [Thermoguttaceae bacterium]
MAPVIIRDLDPRTFQRLQAEAERRGVDVDRLAGQQLRDALGTTLAETRPEPHHDLDHLAGTWSEEETESFFSAVAHCRRVDENLWQ